jgi:coenzyme F420-reducing hydrogenase delta subunit
MEKLKPKLAERGFSPERLWTAWLSAADGPKFAAIIKDMAAKLSLAR